MGLGTELDKYKSALGEGQMFVIGEVGNPPPLPTTPTTTASNASRVVYITALPRRSSPTSMQLMDTPFQICHY